MKSITATLFGAVVLAGALALAGSLSACGEKPAETTADVATKKIPNTSLPRLYTVRRGGNLVAAVFNDGQTPPGGMLVYSASMPLPNPGDSWDVAGQTPPSCAEYHPQIPDAHMAEWQAPPGPPEDDWRQFVSNISNDQPCPPMAPEGE